MNLLTIKSAFKESIPVMMGYLVLGFAFGMLLVSKGFPIYYAFIMSCFIYAGSMQFVTISLLAGQASFISSFIMTLMVNARHLVYGLSMLKKFKTLIGFFVSIICLIIFGSDNFVIFSMILIMIILILVKPRLKNE